MTAVNHSSTPFYHHAEKKREIPRHTQFAVTTQPHSLSRQSKSPRAFAIIGVYTHARTHIRIYTRTCSRERCALALSPLLSTVHPIRVNPARCARASSRCIIYTRKRGAYSKLAYARARLNKSNVCERKRDKSEWRSRPHFCAFRPCRTHAHASSAG